MESLPAMLSGLLRYQIPDEWPYEEARKLFKEPLVSDGDELLEIKWSAPDEEGLINFLVNENEFNSNRKTKAIEKIKASKNKSSQGRLESFFKPAVSTSAPIKRKVWFHTQIDSQPSHIGRLLKENSNLSSAYQEATCVVVH